MRWRAGGLALAMGLAGCGRGFFHAEGAVASDGGGLGRWRSVPQGCTRDAFDGLPQEKTGSILTLLWQNPGARDPLQDNYDTAPDAPMRLEIARAATGDGVVAAIHTKKTGGTRLDEAGCRVLRLETREEPARFAEGRPTLAGRLVLDCAARGGRVTGDVRFSRCGF